MLILIDAPTQTMFNFESVAPSIPDVVPVAPAFAGVAPDGPPTIARPEDIAADFAANAYYWTSFDPEGRGRRQRQEYADAVNDLYAELWPLARSDDQRAVLATQMERYRLGYVKHLSAYLASHSRVASAMITGPAKFPTARNEKRGRAADNKLAELVAWEVRARKAIRQALLSAASDDDKLDAEWSPVRGHIRRCLDVITKIDGGGEFYERSAFVNSITGKVERLATAGNVELVDRALALVADHNAQSRKPAITSRHRFWTFGDLARRTTERHDAEATQVEADGPATIAAGDGVEVLANHAADRVQIVYPAKPDRDTIARLKSAGWKWAPSAGAWQRQLTDNARRSALEITGLAPIA